MAGPIVSMPHYIGYNYITGMRSRELLTPDIPPLIDVIFILLIFFMVTSVFCKEEEALSLRLSEAAAAPLPNNAWN